VDLGALSAESVTATLAAMTHVNQIVGGYGECVAARHLVGLGMAVLDRNWRGTSGELDLVLRDGRDLVFCEVKTRRSKRFGTPVEAIVPAKVARLRRLAAQWLAATRVRPDQVRFDVVSVLVRMVAGPDGRAVPRPIVEHLRGAF
jgi:putative endonuclease